MALEVVSSTSERRERVLIYGDPKTGKTRLATSLTERFWPAVYIAWDEGSENLSSVLTRYRQHLKVLKPRPQSGKWDPVADAFEIVAGNAVQKVWPDARTIIWDTMTAASRDFLQYIADSGQFSQSQHVSIGSPGSAGRQNLPMQGDYMATHNVIDRLMGFAFQRPQHLIVVCHATYDEPDGGGTPEFGPATVGKATVRKFPGRFDAVIHIEKKLASGGPNQPARTAVTAHTERHGLWSAGIRSHHEYNPIPKVVLEADPNNFWRAYDEALREAKVAAT